MEQSSLSHTTMLKVISYEAHSRDIIERLESSTASNGQKSDSKNRVMIMKYFGVLGFQEVVCQFLASIHRHFLA